MDQPLISVIVPIYNVEKYLNRCIDSIVGQTYKNLEIILVDDGSPDNCPAMCDEWARKDSRIRVIHKTNAGQGMARNDGIEKAKGEYIFFIDSDDYVSEKMIEECVASAKSNSADVVIFDRCDVYNDGRIKKQKITAEKLVYNREDILNDFLPGLFIYKYGFGISTCCKMFRLDLIKHNNIRFRSEREASSEDAMFTLEFFAKINKAVINPQCFYYYYKNGNSFSRSYNPERQKQNDGFLLNGLELIKKFGLPESTSLCLKARYHIYTIACAKQIVASGLPRSEKRRELRNNVFSNHVLLKTLESDVIKLAGYPSNVFWRLLKLRMFNLCYFLLWLKSH